jgi:hypothetical protein
MISFVRIFRSLSIYLQLPGWTIQKLFLVLTGASSLMRCSFFALVYFLSETEVLGTYFVDLNEHDHPLFTIINNIPRVLLFSTYVLLILFWYLAKNSLSLSLPLSLSLVLTSSASALYICGWDGEYGGWKGGGSSPRSPQNVF